MANRSTRFPWSRRRKGRSRPPVEGTGAEDETFRSTSARSANSTTENHTTTMSRRKAMSTSTEAVISIVGPGMRIIGDCETTGTVRVEGAVEGSIRAGKAVVVGKDGNVQGDISTQDAVISGTVHGTLVVESRLELQSTCRIEGEVHATRIQLEEGAVLNGRLNMGGKAPTSPKLPVSASSKPQPQEAADKASQPGSASHS